jgi:hypothetical protein
MPPSRTLALALSLAFATLGSTGIHAATDVQGPSGLLKGQVPDDRAALKRVAITGFVVQYVTDFGVETKRTRGGTFYSKWKDAPPAALQATTQALYTQLVADLKAGGVEVVPADQVAAQPGLAEVRKAARPSPATVDDSSLRKTSVLVAAQDLPLVLATVPDAKLDSYATQPVEGTDPPRQLMGWDEQASQWLAPTNLEMSSLATIYFGQAKAADALKATALNVRITVPLVDLGVTTAGNTGSGLFGSAKVTGVIKPNPRIVEGGTVFGFAQAGGNPGHRHLVALQKPLPLAGLKVSADPDKVSLDDTIFGKQSARGSGLFGALAGAAGTNDDAADFWVSVDASTLEPALIKAASPMFKELAQILAGGK